MTLRKCLSMLMLVVSYGVVVGQAWQPNTDGVMTVHNGPAQVGGDMRAHQFVPDYSGNGNNGTNPYPGYLFGTPGSGMSSTSVSGGPNYQGVDFWSGWAVRMSMSSSGRLGVGVRSPEVRLHLKEQALTLLKLQNDFHALNARVGIDFSTSNLANHRSGRIEVWDNAAAGASQRYGSMLFYTKSASSTLVDEVEERMRISYNGNVGVGQFSYANAGNNWTVPEPEAKFHVASPNNTTLKISNAATSGSLNPAVDFMTRGGLTNMSNARIQAFDKTGNQADLVFYAGAPHATAPPLHEVLRLQSNSWLGADRRVGIGGMSIIESNLHIHATQPTLKLTSETGSNGVCTIQFRTNNGSTSASNAYIQAKDMGSLGAYRSELGFYTNGTTGSFSPTEKLRITNDGKVGIGTYGSSAPNSQLSVYGTAPTFELSTSTSATGFKISDIAGKSVIQTQAKPLVLNPATSVNGNNKSISYVAIGFDPDVLSPNNSIDDKYQLIVKGKVMCEELKIKLSTAWPDYVFDEKYKLRSLGSVESYIAENKHLPEVPSAEEVKEKGIETGEMNAVLLKKVEELTLYMIQQQKEIEALKKRNAEIETLLTK